MDQDQDLLSQCQDMPFPSWLPRDTRIKIRAKFLELPRCADDDEESGLTIVPPSSDIDFAMCVTSRRMAKAFKIILGDKCGNPPAENVESFQDFLDEQRERGF